MLIEDMEYVIFRDLDPARVRDFMADYDMLRRTLLQWGPAFPGLLPAARHNRARPGWSPAWAKRSVMP
jgi:hypothetical protein